jgi:hypothetical protein
MPDPNDAFDGADPQDSAESLDETNYDESEGVGEMRTFEELPDVLDVTQAIGDRDDDEALTLDADEFDENAIDDADLEDDNELDYRASTEEHEDDLDGLGPDGSYDEDRVAGPNNIEGLDEQVGDAETVEGGEDDITDYQAKTVGDSDLEDMGYSENRKGEIRAKP